ncbi:MAG: YggU family protein [Chloroflexi bacterium]|nr:YggU family protein [Chloroflexota bacterium]
MIENENGKPAESNSTLKIRVQPKSSRNQIDGFDNDTLRLRVTAPPTDGKANAGVIALLAKTLGISKTRIEIIRGHSSRDKVVSIRALTAPEVLLRIESAGKD